ncbi:unnamed protein product [Pylaiella littoralis]
MQRQQRAKRGLDRSMTESDEWDDLPFVRDSQPAPRAASISHPSARAPTNHAWQQPQQQHQHHQHHQQHHQQQHHQQHHQKKQQQQQHKQQQPPRQQQHLQHPPRLHQPSPQHQQTRLYNNAPDQQRKRSRSTGDPRAVPPSSSSSNPTQPPPVSRAVTVPTAAKTTTGPTVASSTARAVAAAPNQQKKKKEKEPVACRRFKAGYCSSGVLCRDVHDGRQAEQERTAWLAGGPLPDPQPEQWSMVLEMARRSGGPYGGLPGPAAGVPPVLVIADVGTKNKVTEFVCLAMETSTGRQLSRFARFVRVSPTTAAAPPPSTAVTPPPTQLAVALALPSHQQQLIQQPPQQLMQQPPQQLMQQPPQQLVVQQQPQQLVVQQQPPHQLMQQQPPHQLMQQQPPHQLAVTATPPVQGVSNPLSSALPLPDVLQELQQWMASLGLNPGPRDAAGFTERGNFRWVVTHGSGFPKIPDLIGEHKLQIPDHLRSWTDAARMCGWEGDRLNAQAAASAAAATGQTYVVAGGAGSQNVGNTAGKPKHVKHALPQAGLNGMLKFLGCPAEPVVPNRTKRGINNVQSLAQCVVCMVRLGVPMPVTSRTTQMWEGAGGYAGSRHEELRIEQPPVVLAGAAPAPTNVVVGPPAGGGAGRMEPQPLHAPPAVLGVGGGPAPMVTPAVAPAGLSGGGMGNNNGNGAEKQGKKKKKKKSKNGGTNNMNSNSTNGPGTNEMYVLPQREGPLLLGGQTQQQLVSVGQQQQQQQLVPVGQQQQQQQQQLMPVGQQQQQQQQLVPVGQQQQQQKLVPVGQQQKLVPVGQQQQLVPVGHRGDGPGGPQWQNGAPGGGGGGGGAGGGNGQSAPHWRQSIPISYLSPDYLDYFVREKERQYYKSAGVLPYRRDLASGEVWILLGSEKRRNKLVLSCLGGKREDADAGPEHTAWREFWEESGKVLGDGERAGFLTACFEGRARAMWMQNAKMAVLACELNSPAFVSLPQSYTAGGTGVDKGDTSMVALHWVSASELHRACHTPGGTVVIWGPQPQAVVAAPAPQQQQQQQQQWNGVAPGVREELPAGISKRQQKKLLAQQRMLAQDPHKAGLGGDAGVGGTRGRRKRPAGKKGNGESIEGFSRPLQLPLSSQHQQQQQQHQQQYQQQQQQQQQNPPTPPPIVPMSVEPFPLLRTLVTNRSFQLFFAQLAAAGTSNQRFVPVLNGTA